MYVHFKPSSNSLHHHDNDPTRTVTAVSQFTSLFIGGGSHLPAAAEITGSRAWKWYSQSEYSAAWTVRLYFLPMLLGDCACVHSVLGGANHGIGRLEEPEVSTRVRNGASHMGLEGEMPGQSHVSHAYHPKHRAYS